MPGKDKQVEETLEKRRRYPSRPAKGTVSDIAMTFKKKMSSPSANMSPVSEKSNSMPKRTSSRNKSNKENKESKDVAKQVLKEDENGMLVLGREEDNSSKAKSNSSQDKQDKQDNRNENLDEGVVTTAPTNNNNDNTNSIKESSGESEGAQAISLNKEPTSKDASCDKACTSNNEIMQALSEIKQTLNKFEDAIFDPKNGLEVQLGKTIERVDNIYTDIHGAVSGIFVRLDVVEKSSTENAAKLANMETNITKLSKLLDENKKIAQQLSLMQGIIHKFAQHGAATSAKITDLTKRGMEQNLLIHRVEEVAPGSKENCKQSIIQFLQEFLDLEVEPKDIWKSHRLGYPRDGHVRPMVIKTAYHIKDAIMENLGKLKGKTNSTTGKPLFISEQVPEAVSESRKEISTRLAIINKSNDQLPPDRKKKIQVQNDKILANGQIIEPEVSPPQPSELFLDGELQTQVNHINQEFVMTETTQVKHSEFMALALRTDTIERVQTAYKAAMQRFPSADHVMVAYTLKEHGKVKIGHCDDGEHGGGMIIRKAMSRNKSKDTVVFVIRCYGGLHLGYERFQTIDKVAQEALDMLSD